MRLTPAILCGGSGTRLWPVSRRRVPKQFHAFLNGASLLEAAARRVSGAEFNPVIAIGATDACHLVRHQIEQAGSRIGKIICEPVSRNTAPAIAALCAVLIDEQDDSPVVAIPSDHYIPDSRGLIDAVEAMLDDVDNGSIGIIGITPTRADTDLGYIMLSGAGTRGVAADVRSFVEKPSAEQAEALVAGGEAYWNAGIFVFRPSALWQELNKFAPELAKLAAEAARKGRRAGLVHHLDQDVFSACPNVSIDTAVMEKTDLAVCVPTGMSWSDVGSWNALWHASDRDARNNAAHGNVVLRDVADCQIYSSGPLVAALGVVDLVIAVTEDAVLVADRQATSELRNLVEEMRAGNPHELDEATTEFRPWGRSRKLGRGDQFQVKELSLQVGEAISLQVHRRRSEHWVIVEGEAEVTKGDEVVRLGIGESIDIPPGTTHQLRNAGEAILRVIEVQLGEHILESDIERLEQ